MIMYSLTLLLVCFLFFILFLFFFLILRPPPRSTLFPYTTLFRSIFFTEPFPEIPGPIPLTTDRASGFYFRKEMEQVLLSPGDVEDIGADFEVPMDWRRLDEAVDKAVRRVPVLESAKIAGGWAGLRPLTPDDHAIIGWAPGVQGFFLAVGFGGHGFQHS